jgi:hypothetical protein
MNENFTNEVPLSKAIALLKDGIPFTDIEYQLIKDGNTEDQVKDILKDLQSFKNKKRLSAGFKTLLTGAAFLLSSCLLSLITDYSNSNFLFILYGLTIIGACILMGGFILIFG